jgi:nickel/cobalt transporter (NicO) family protein
MIRLFPKTLCSIGVMLVCLSASKASAHPLNSIDHDRFLEVQLQKTDSPDKLRVRVKYRVEAMPLVLIDDMKEYIDRKKSFEYFPARELEYYAEYTRTYEPVIADRLVADVNKKRLEFKGISRKETLRDDDGKSLGHVRCDFVFEATVDRDPNATTRFEFQDQTYQLEPGRIVLNFVDETGLAVESVIAPDDALRKRVREDDYRLREITATFAATPNADTTPPSEPPVVEPRDSHDDAFSLSWLILQSDYGLWLTLLLAFFFGAAHALTPGHGKTLVAAYLVGERGTIWHAMFLGLVTTLTHTGVVILLAVIMALLPNDAQRSFQKWIQNGLGLVLGLTVACMGFWLLLQRLAGRADHVHVGGGHHGPSARELSWWGLVMLGVTGGIVPCWDAIILLFYTVGTNRFWLVLPAVLAFSAGLAVVLVLIGILVVQVPRFVEARGGDGKLLRSLPLVSALAVLAVGLWLCFEWSQGR